MKKKICPACLNLAHRPGGECSICGFRLPLEFQRTSLLVISLVGSAQKKFYTPQLFRCLVDGFLLEKGLAMRILSTQAGVLGIYKVGFFGKMNPIKLVKFFNTDLENSQCWVKIIGSYIYFLKDKQDEKGLEDFLFSYEASLSLWQRYWKRASCVITMAAEPSLCFENDLQENAGEGLFLSFVNRRHFGVRWGRRLLILLERVFSKIRFDCFDVSLHNRWDEKRLWESFVWILETEGVLKKDLKHKRLGFWLLGTFSKLSSYKKKIMERF